MNKEIELWNKAVSLMPRGTQTLSKCPDQFVNGVYPKFVDSGVGAYLKGLDGKEYLDFMCGLGPIILGYNDKKVNQAIKDQLEKGIIFSLPTVLEQELAELVTQVVPCAEQVRFAKNGTDVNLAAVRIARSYTKKEKILKPKGGYHGWGDWHIASMRPNGVPSCLKELIEEFEFNDLNSLETLLNKGDVAAVIIEPQALTAPAPGFLEGVRSLCDLHKAVLIFDEIVTGFRWSVGGAQSYYGVTPDLCCLGKAMGNGMPISAIAGKKRFMEELENVFFSMTFGGECLSLAASIETIKQLKEKDYSHIWKLGNLLEEGFTHLSKKHDLAFNFPGSAPRHAMNFDSSIYKDSSGLKALFMQEMVKKEILFPNVIYIQFSHSENDILKTIDAADESLKMIKNNLNNIDNVLKGHRATEIFRKNT